MTASNARLFVLLCLLISNYGDSHAQAAAEAARDRAIQPTIMVIPFTPQGQTLRKAYERSELVRVAITEVKEGFDDRSVNTIDLRAKLKQVGNTELLEDDQKSNIKDEVIKLSGADIYVEVEVKTNRSGSGNSVTLILTAFDAFSGESYANKVGTSPKFFTEDFSRLVTRVVDKEIDNFLNTIHAKFDDLIKNGRTVILNIGVAEGSEWDFDREIDPEGTLLSDGIEDWVYDNSFQNYYHIQGTTSTKIIFDMVKVPLRDERGRNFRLSSFAGRLRNYIASLDIDCSRVINGNQIVITLE